MPHGKQHKRVPHPAEVEASTPGFLALSVVQLVIMAAMLAALVAARRLA